MHTSTKFLLQSCSIQTRSVQTSSSVLRKNSKMTHGIASVEAHSITFRENAWSDFILRMWMGRFLGHLCTFKGSLCFCGNRPFTNMCVISKSCTTRTLIWFALVCIQAAWRVRERRLACGEHPRQHRIPCCSCSQRWRYAWSYVFGEHALATSVDPTVSSCKLPFFNVLVIHVTLVADREFSRNPSVTTISGALLGAYNSHVDFLYW